MTLPASFAREGFLAPDKLRGKLRRLMVTTEGWDNTGKTEFAISAPGPGIVLCLDRGYEAMLDNPRPPKTRRSDFAYDIIKVPLPTQMKQDEYLEYWRVFQKRYNAALANPDARTVVIDGDSDSWELQRLAEFGRVSQVPPHLYVAANAARRAHIAKAFDSGKIVIATNKLKDEYETQMVNGKEKQVKTGKTQRQGFRDTNYLWQVRVENLRKDNTFGLRIWMAKADTSLHGMELWGEDCCFQGLVQTIYPDVDLKEWGY